MEVGKVALNILMKLHEHNLPKESVGIDLTELDLIFRTPIKFGLYAQGHIPTIEKMLQDGKSWEEIGSKISWLPESAQKHYEEYKKGK